MPDKKVDLMIIIPPASIRNTLWPPYGAMYIASYLRREGYRTEILNVDLERLDNRRVVERVKEASPRCIGYSGIVATSYGYIKELSRDIRRSFPDKVQILGGGISSAAEVILKNTAVDIVVYGEGEVTVLELLKRLDDKGDLSGVLGIYYKDGSGCRYTGRRPLVSNLDSLPYPAFDLVDMDEYMPDGAANVREFTDKVLDSRVYDKRRSRRTMNILTNRGCIGVCGFCVRHYPGMRVHSIKYVFDLIEHCIKKFNVGFFAFGDDCFAPNKARNWEFIKEYKRRRLDIIFRISGMRVDTVDEDILKAYKDIGCWLINYGFESGSQKVLDIIGKRVSVEQNRNVALWMRKAGIYAPAQIIIGMPGETDETIGETVDFLKSSELDYKQYKITYALPIPGAPLYEYARLTGAIEDEDEYLSSLWEIEGSSVLHVNLTDEKDEAVAAWKGRMMKELDSHYLSMNYKTKNYLLRRVSLFLKLVGLHMRRRTLLEAAARMLRRLAAIGLKVSGKSAKAVCVRFGKKRDIKIERFVKKSEEPSPNRDIWLKNINDTLKKEGAYSDGRV